MGATKTELFSIQENEIATLAKALGHPARVAILSFLLQKADCICTDIVNELPLAQPTISQHLRELKNAGFIKGTIAGTAICYCINDATVLKFKTYFDGLSQQLTTQKNNCC